MSTATVADRFSIGRTARLTRWNAVLLTRNRLAFVYAVVMPLLPLLLLFTGERGDRDRRRGRRSSRMLARRRTVPRLLQRALAVRQPPRRARAQAHAHGRDPRRRTACQHRAARARSAALVPSRRSRCRSSQLFDQPLPVNPIIYAAAAVMAVIMFTAFAYWTAAWTGAPRPRS